MSGVVLVKFNNPAPTQVQQTALGQQQQPGMVPNPYATGALASNGPSMWPNSLSPESGGFTADERTAIPPADSARADMYGGLSETPEDSPEETTESGRALNELEAMRAQKNKQRRTGVWSGAKNAVRNVGRQLVGVQGAPSRV